MPTSTFSIREAYLQASSFLQQENVRDAAVCAELLLQHLLGVSRSELFMRWHEPFPETLNEPWQKLVERKAKGEPVQYIVGKQEFYGLPFHVDESVLIPRPETELLVEQIVGLGRGEPAGGSTVSRPLTVADVGTGSGAIAVAVAKLVPEWTVVATDISPAALEVARRNAALNEVGGRITFLLGDLLMPLADSRLAVDILVSNPPYIPTADLAGLQPEVLHEPRLALDGGEDGLNCYRRMMRQIGRLSPVPWLIGLEVGQGQAKGVEQLLKLSGYWNEIRIVRDLAGIERHVIGLRKK